MSAISFYTGMVTHRRFGAVTHKLRYRIAYLLVDLDQLERAGKASHLLGVERRNLMTFRSKDHGNGADHGLASWVRGYLSGNDVPEDAARIELLTLPRMFGYVFNPISVFFIYDATGSLHHILYEVNNTFGGRTFYLCRADQAGPVADHTSEKALYVSPFFDVEGQYRFKVQPPADSVALTIRYDHADGAKAMMASLVGQKAPVTTWKTLGVLARYPLMTFGVVASIHWEALKLWLKGARYRSRPSTTPTD